MHLIYRGQAMAALMAPHRHWFHFFPESRFPAQPVSPVLPILTQRTCPTLPCLQTPAHRESRLIPSLDTSETPLVSLLRGWSCNSSSPEPCFSFVQNHEKTDLVYLLQSKHLKGRFLGTSVMSHFLLSQGQKFLMQPFNLYPALRALRGMTTDFVV